MKLIITIDTEEDNWSSYHATDNPVENIEQIIPLQRLFDQFGYKPTYLVSYPVATSQRSVSILKRIVDEGKCEIGMHCHPWNTPPYDESEHICEHDTMLCNLPVELQHLKLSALHEVICKNFGITPVSFRAGRWGYGPTVAQSLYRLGYKVDTSISPFVNWAIYQGPDFSTYGPEPFRFNPESISSKDNAGVMLQVPATVGFLQQNYTLCNQLMKMLECDLGRKFRIKGILQKLRLLNKVWLSPEHADTKTMIMLAQRMQRNKYPCLNMMFHSTSLMGGLSPLVYNSEDEKKFFQTIKEFLSYAHASHWESCTLAQFADGF